MAIRSFDEQFYGQVLDPIASQVTATTAYIEVFAKGNRAVFEIPFGAVGTSIVAKLVQATDAAAAGTKDITGATVTVLNAAENGVATIEIGPAALDDAGGFKFVACTVTAVGTCVWGVTLWIHDLRQKSPTQHATYAQHASVVL